MILLKKAKKAAEIHRFATSYRARALGPSTRAKTIAALKRQAKRRYR